MRVDRKICYGAARADDLDGATAYNRPVPDIQTIRLICVKTGPLTNLQMPSFR